MLRFLGNQIVRNEVICKRTILGSHFLFGFINGGLCRRAGLGFVLLVDRMRERCHSLIVLEFR